MISTAALAHASGRMVVLTLPTGPFRWGAAVAVLATALLGTLFRPGPAPQPRQLAEWRSGGVLGSWIGAAIAALLVLAGVFGPRDPFENPLPLTLWTVIWVLLPLVTVVTGDLWRPVAPWRGPVRLARRVLGLTGGIGLSRLGHLPAVVGFLGFAWFEIVSLAPTDPQLLAKVVGLYWLAIFLLATLEGEDWLDRGEMLTLYFATLARIAPLWRERARGVTRMMAARPAAQIEAMAPPSASYVAFVTLLIASVSFDGLAESFFWLARIGINPLDFPGRSAVLWPNSAGLLVAWALVAGSILAATRLGGLPPRVLLSFLPIAAGYHLAHYLVALLTQGQYLLAALNDPLERGWALLGLPEHWVSFGFQADRTAVWTIWAVQFALILGAHLLAVVLSLRLAPGQRLGHVPLALLMVGFTSLGLWLLSTPVAG